MSTTLTVRAARADIVELAIRQMPELVETIDDVQHLPRLRSWSPAILGAAIDDLVSAGRLVEAADGRLCVTGAR